MLIIIYKLSFGIVCVNFKTINCKNAEHVVCCGANEQNCFRTSIFSWGEKGIISECICCKQKGRNLKMQSEIHGSLSCPKWNYHVCEIISLLPLEILYTTAKLKQYACFSVLNFK